MSPVCLLRRRDIQVDRAQLQVSGRCPDQRRDEVLVDQPGLIPCQMDPASHSPYYVLIFRPKQHKQYN